MKVRKLFILGGLMLAAVTTVSCEKDASSDDIYGIEKKEITEQDT